VYIYSVHTNLLQLLNVSSRLKSTQVGMPLSSQLSSRVCSSRPPSTWGHFSLKSGHVSIPQRLSGLRSATAVRACLCGGGFSARTHCTETCPHGSQPLTLNPSKSQDIMDTV